MKKIQKLIIIVGALAIALIILFPPWFETVEKVNHQTSARSVNTNNQQGHYTIFTPPEIPEPFFDVSDGIPIVDVNYSYAIEWKMFLLQVFAVTIITSILFFATNRPERERSDESIQCR